jgi:hypothetical protein
MLAENLSVESRGSRALHNLSIHVNTLVNIILKKYLPGYILWQYSPQDTVKRKWHIIIVIKIAIIT